MAGALQHYTIGLACANRFGITHQGLHIIAKSNMPKGIAMQKAEVETPKQDAGDVLLSTVKEAINKILVAVYLALFALLIFLGGVFLSGLWRNSGKGPSRDWTAMDLSAVSVLMIVLFALFFFLGREWERRRPRKKFKMIRFPNKDLLWKGFPGDGSVEPMPYCPDHGMRLFMRNNEFYCPKCGSKKFSMFRSGGPNPNSRIEQLNKGAASVLQGFIDKKVRL